jgi:hypothetical protein
MRGRSSIPASRLSRVASTRLSQGQASAQASPLDSPGLRLLLDFSTVASVVQVSGLVSAALDASPHLNHPFQSDPTLRFSWSSSGINGLGSLVSSSVGPNWMGFSSPPLLGATEATVWLVCQNDSEAGNQGSPLEYWGTSASANHLPYSGGVYQGLCSSVRYGPDTFAAGSLVVPQLYTFRSGPGEWSMHQGRTLIHGELTDTFDLGSAPILGCDFAVGFLWPGKVSFLAAVDFLASHDDQAWISAHCLDRWATPL